MDSNYPIMSVQALRRARKGDACSYKGTIYSVARITRKRDRVWLAPMNAKFMPRWDVAKKDYVFDLARDVALPVIEVSKRMVQNYDRARKAARVAFRTVVKKVRLETNNFIFFREGAK